MKYHYGYSDKVTDYKPNPNMDLVLQKMMAEAHWEMMQNAEPSTENGEVIQGREAEDDRPDEPSVLSLDSHHQFPHPVKTALPEAKQNRTPAQYAASEDGEQTRNWIDRKI